MYFGMELLHYRLDYVQLCRSWQTVFQSGCKNYSFINFVEREFQLLHFLVNTWYILINSYCCVGQLFLRILLSSSLAWPQWTSMLWLRCLLLSLSFHQSIAPTWLIIEAWVSVFRISVFLVSDAQYLSIIFCWVKEWVWKASVNILNARKPDSH